jgi:NitT/TauT family transport system substrate-binding protein
MGILGCFFFLFIFKKVNRIIPVFLIVLLILSAACSRKKTIKTPAKTETKVKADSAQLVFAVLPTLDCLPFYIAAKQHIYDSLGIHVNVVVYRSQMDAEQSVLKGKSDGCATDMFRVGLLQSQKEPIRFLFTTNREWQLVANKVLRISNIGQINDRMIGITRNSSTDYLCDFVVSHLKPNNQILRAQINSVVVRLEMLENNQIETAFLPQPMAFIARKHGHTVLPLSADLCKGFCGFAISSRIMKSPEYRNKLNIFLKGYNIAVERLTKNDRLLLPSTTLQDFLLNDIADSIATHKVFKKATSASTDKVAVTLKWLQLRNVVRSTYRADTLLYKN